MKKKIIIFGIIGFILSFIYPFMEVLIDISERIGYCENCDFNPFWKHITSKEITYILIFAFIGTLLGGAIGFLIHKVLKK